MRAEVAVPETIRCERCLTPIEGEPHLMAPLLLRELLRWLGLRAPGGAAGIRHPALRRELRSLPGGGAPLGAVRAGTHVRLGLT